MLVVVVVVIVVVRSFAEFFVEGVLVWRRKEIGGGWRRCDGREDFGRAASFGFGCGKDEKAAG